MCIAIPGRILELPTDHPDLAVVDVEGTRHTVNVGMLDAEALQTGGWLLIHAGFAMSSMEESEAKDALEFLASIEQAYDDLMVVEMTGSKDPW